jgi:hypothetical protein
MTDTCRRRPGPPRRREACTEDQMGACAALWRRLFQAYGQWDLFEVVVLDAGHGSLGKAILIDAAGWRCANARRLSDSPVARGAAPAHPRCCESRARGHGVGACHGQWVRSRRWRTTYP